MTPEQAISRVQNEPLLPVYLIVGEERYLRNQVVEAIQRVYQKDAIAGLNEDDFIAGERDVSQILGAARTLPMMAKRRWVLVRELDRWEAKGRESKAKDKDKAKAKNPLDEIAAYCESAADSTVLVLTASKLDARRRLMTVGKKQGFLVKCDPISKNALPAWVQKAAERRGRRIAPSASELIAEVAGPELSVIDDVLERLSLFVEGDQEINEEHVGDLIPVVRPSTVWELVDAVGRGDIGRALGSLARVYDPQDRGLRLLSVLGWSARQLIRYQAARAEGKRPEQAAQAAGAPPFRARNLEAQVQKAQKDQFEGWLRTLRTIDLELKGGSKRPPRAILESALIELCRKRPDASATASPVAR